ncbi:MAG TPA: MucR family transcriptional regulator [Azospirillum sp.]|nr:MucR family transcriptional regulator [Azospirillum sp.]
MAEELQRLTAQIVAAYVANNDTAVNDVPVLIQGVYSALNRTDRESTEAALVDSQQPAVPIKKSVTPKAVLCLECGKAQKMLKRHLETAHDLTPEGYRAKWHLPRDYPMVAPNYAAQRSEMAKAFGLGGDRRRPTSKKE